MEQTTYASRMRYLAADDVDDATLDFDGLDVRGPDGKKLGDIDGFIVDAAASRVYYVVVDSGGWFTSRRFLLPIGHATVDRDRRALRVDVTDDVLRGYPEFDPDRFRDLSDEELRAFERRTLEACCPDEPVDAAGSSTSHYDRRHYTQPDWWIGRSVDRSRLRPVEAGVFHGGTATGVPVREQYDREHVTAREGGDVSPHPGGRAQPGDVLGIETGGEQTHMGDTAEEEDKRRRAAERAAVEDEPRRSER